MVSPSNLCPACGAMDCLCAQFHPDCLGCLRPEDECICDMGSDEDCAEEEEDYV